MTSGLDAFRTMPPAKEQLELHGTAEKQSSLLLQNWVFMHHDIKFQKLVTDANCFPVADFIGSNSAYIQQYYYFDMTKTIKDPSVFTPPSYCDKANDMHDDSAFQQKMFASLFSALK